MMLCKKLFQKSMVWKGLQILKVSNPDREGVGLGEGEGGMDSFLCERCQRPEWEDLKVGRDLKAGRWNHLEGSSLNPFSFFQKTCWVSKNDKNVGWDLSWGCWLKRPHVASPCGLGFLTTWWLGYQGKCPERKKPVQRALCSFLISSWNSSGVPPTML